MRPRLLLLFGATASGKTALVEGLAGSGPRFELISADSMQVYRGMDIGTAKPSAAFREKIPHHLIDIRDPREQYCAGDFARDALEAARLAMSRGALPLVSGGTGFYLKNLVMGLSAAPPSDPAVREALQRELREGGPGPLRCELEAADPESAERIHPNDHYRLTRALEVWRCSGRPLSSFPPPAAPRDDIDYLAVGVRRPREELRRRIDERVEEMFRAGLAAEAESLRGSGLRATDPGMAAIGYSEFFEAAGGSPFDALDAEVLAAVKERIKTDTRRYAKRQELFFRDLPGARWIEADDLPSLLRAARDFWGS